jgi:hypothetical protein
VKEVWNGYVKKGETSYRKILESFMQLLREEGIFDE